MTSSRARLVGHAERGETRAQTAATTPQRWTIARGARDGWLDVTHQLLGDGVFGGDSHRTSIVAKPEARLGIRAVAATPLRGEAPGTTVTHLRAAEGASLLYLPGALIPHLGSNHRNVLRIDAAAGSRVLAASIVVPGRTGMGERNAFCSLRMRTVVTYGGRLALAEEALVRPDSFAIDGPAGFAGDGASIAVIALGDWPSLDSGWWHASTDVPGIAGGAAPLRSDGVVFRALAVHLGAAQRCLQQLEACARASLATL